MYNWYLLSLQSFIIHTAQVNILYKALPLIESKSTYLAPSSCDRNCPPSYQVACRLTPFAPPFTQSTHPFRIPRTPIAQRLTTTTLGPLRFHYAEHQVFIYERLRYNVMRAQVALDRLWNPGTTQAFTKRFRRSRR